MNKYKSIILFILLSLPLSLSSFSQIKTWSVPAIVETTAVESNEDAADDPAVWINSENPASSLIFATNKRQGIEVYNLQGQRIQMLPIHPFNNIDIVQGILIQQQRLDLAITSSKKERSVYLFKINPSNGKAKLFPYKITTNIRPYGLCAAQAIAPETGIHVFVTSKVGIIEHWKLDSLRNGVLQSTLQRIFKTTGISEGCVADLKQKNLYIADEQTGVWKFSLKMPYRAQLIIPIKNQAHLKEDLEGLALYQKNQIELLLISVQGNGTFAVYNNLPPHQYRGSFRINANGLIDKTTHTDGIASSSASLGPTFPQGIFIAQDDHNTDSKGRTLNQNFKMVDWRAILQALKISFPK